MTKETEAIDWAVRTKGLLKAELKRRDISYRELAERLESLGIKENERNIANKIARGSFTAVFLIQCLEAIGVKKLRLGE
jgi:3-mercaptopyruvate sulfurtransferase SseA